MLLGYWTIIMVKPDKLRIIVGQSKVLKYDHYIMKIAQGEIISYACKQKVLVASVMLKNHRKTALLFAMFLFM